MAYKYATGSVQRGDIYDEDDVQGNTYIHWASVGDALGIVAGGTTVFVVSGSTALVGVGTSVPDYTLDVAGTVGIDSYIYHNGDADTYLKFTGNEVNIVAGAKSMITLDYNNNSNDKIILNNTNANIDVQVMADDGEVILHTDAGTNMVGIGITAPAVALDVHYTGSADPTVLGNDEGGGEVVYFGTGSLSAGALYYLNDDGGWAQTSAEVTGSGHDQLLAISLGTAPTTNGMLVKGYFDVNTYFSGSFIKGKPIYICSSSAAEDGYMSGAAPTDGDAYVRVVGYATDTANVIYFNPDSTYVEIESEE
jgi:hypothetical protein